jgi:hypothetical protein
VTERPRWAARCPAQGSPAHCRGSPRPAGPGRCRCGCRRRGCRPRPPRAPPDRPYPVM